MKQGFVQLVDQHHLPRESQIQGKSLVPSSIRPFELIAIGDS